MKDPEKIEQQSKDKMAVVTSFERMIIGDKVCLDTKIDGQAKFIMA